MQAGLRFKMVYLAGALLAAAVPAFAQTVPDASNNTPATDAVGPRELQNFSLPGTTTKPADQPANSQGSVSPAPRETRRAELKPRPSTAVPARHEPSLQVAAQTNGQARSPAKMAKVGSPVEPQAAPSSMPVPVAIQPASPSFSSASGPPAAPPVPIAPDHRLPLLPWFIAAFALAGGVIFLLWRRGHQRQVLAEAGGYDRLVPAEAVPAPSRPAPVAQLAEPESRPVPASAPRPTGIVASRLRPSIELAVQPLRCLVDDEQVTIEFEVELFNAGTAPARAVIAEASLFNASAAQEQELAAFYAKPPGAGDRIDSIPPMRRMTFTNRVVAPRAQIQEYELAGRKAFVPVLAFNALYEWSGGKGQSSLAYLLGRETRGDKLGPLHLDGAGREVRGLGARVLPTIVRS